jgi:AhpD family alkylhydroperoxidase
MLVAVTFGADLKPMIEAFSGLTPEQTDAEDNLPADLVQLIAFASSVAAGCRYCQAHTSHNLDRAGTGAAADAAAAKIDAILNYESDPAFSAGERAALGLAFAASRVPNEAEAGHFEALRQHFSERQIVQIVAVVSMFGFLNRWNDTMATQLETPAADFARDALGAVDWELGKHGEAV